MRRRRAARRSAGARSRRSRRSGAPSRRAYSKPSSSGTCRSRAPQEDEHRAAHPLEVARGSSRGEREPGAERVGVQRGAAQEAVHGARAERVGVRDLEPARRRGAAGDGEPAIRSTRRPAIRPGWTSPASAIVTSARRSSSRCPPAPASTSPARARAAARRAAARRPPPSEWPKTSSRSVAAAARARPRSRGASLVAGSGCRAAVARQIGDDQPPPRQERRSSVKFHAAPPKPCTSSSGGPSPPTKTRIRDAPGWSEPARRGPAADRVASVTRIDYRSSHVSSMATGGAHEAPCPAPRGAGDPSPPAHCARRAFSFVRTRGARWQTT